MQVGDRPQLYSSRVKVINKGEKVDPPGEIASRPIGLLFFAPRLNRKFFGSLVQD